MAKYGKLIGAGLGLALGGPLGALFGLFIGSMFDNIQTIAIPSDGGLFLRAKPGVVILLSV